MKRTNKIMQQLKEWCGDAPVFRQEILEWVGEENLWNLWVPKEFGGLEQSFLSGLQKLQSIARIDGSLGWTVTLCSGANYFIGNLKPEIARKVFAQPAILGGSGGMFGVAEKEGNSYRLNGIWRYATGAPYLTHFTLTARIIENGEEQTNEDGSPKCLSFVIPAREVTIIEDWNTMGLKATATHSFELTDVIVDENYSFVYNTFYQPQSIFKIHFSVFADLTLLVNYLGMAEHLLEEAANLIATEKVSQLQSVVDLINEVIERLAGEIEQMTEKGIEFTDKFVDETHKWASDCVRSLSEEIMKLYPYLGVKAAREDHPINQIFRDYFTATQHHIFTK